MNGCYVKKFTLPNIFSQKKSIPNTSDTFNNLTSTQLRQISNELPMRTTTSINIPKSDKMTVFIPKLISSSMTSNTSDPDSLGESLTPHEMSLKKIMDLKKLHLCNKNNKLINDSIKSDENNENNFTIDLTSALASKSQQQLTVPVKPTVEKINFKFADCDAVAISLPTTHECEINISNIFTEQLSNRTKHTTAFGKILCSRLRRKNLPYVKHTFEPKNDIKPFRFDVLNKFKQKRSNIFD